MGTIYVSTIKNYELGILYLFNTTLKIIYDCILQNYGILSTVN